MDEIVRLYIFCSICYFHKTCIQSMYKWKKKSEVDRYDFWEACIVYTINRGAITGCFNLQPRYVSSKDLYRFSSVNIRLFPDACCTLNFVPSLDRMNYLFRVQFHAGACHAISLLPRRTLLQTAKERGRKKGDRVPWFSMRNRILFHIAARAPFAHCASMSTR